MKKHIYDESNGLSYTLHGDYYLPELVFAEDEEPTYGKYGILRKAYLKEYKTGTYQIMLLQGRLVKHLNLVDREAKERMEMLINQMAKEQGITEQMKEENQMLWVRKMNAVVNAAEEIVLKEIVYV
jgi:hypothetical protein